MSILNLPRRAKQFDTKTLPADMQRVYKNLRGKFGRDYALHVMFTMRTAVELHRAWHMTLLTSKILQQLKDKFRLRMTWNLSVFKLQFRVQDGGNELCRKVPYDYDSEFQDMYMRIAIALMDGHITVDEALIYQSETKLGHHTAPSGWFLRNFPGRLVLYPLVAATCAVIFFNGDWTDFGIAALTGLASGLVEYGLSMIGAGILTDVLVGTSTGIIGGLFYRYNGEDICLSAIFLGTLYWFFYGTAFVIGILEIIAGELETGVTRFIAVSVKTFVLCLGASFGLLVAGNAQQVWYDQADNCGRINLADEWWRIPLYLLCSAAVLGQYRMPLSRYWRALIVMLVGYEVQYQMFEYFAGQFDRDNLDVATSNVFGSAGAVVSACAVSYYVNQLRYYYDGRILKGKDHQGSQTFMGKLIYNFMACGVRVESMLGLGRRSDKMKLDLSESLELKAATGTKSELQDVKLEADQENLILETIVGSQDMNIWCILMPALYQLVPGSVIAKFWFNFIFPPKLIEEKKEIGDTGLFYYRYTVDGGASNVFAGLMIISTSLALGLIIGFVTVQTFEMFFDMCACFQDKLKTDEERKRAKSRRNGMYSAPPTLDDDPGSVAQEFRNAILHGASNEAEADLIFNTVDIDRSDTLDIEEVMDYMLKAGLTMEQITSLFQSMDTDGDGEVSRAEFRKAILDKKNEELLRPQDASPEEEAEAKASELGVPATMDENGFKTQGIAGNAVSMLAGQFGPTEGGVQNGLANPNLTNTHTEEGSSQLADEI